MAQEKEFTLGDLAKLQKPVVEKVKIPGTGFTAYVRVITASEKDSYELSIYDKTKPTFGKVRAGLLVRAWCDAAGKRLFTDDVGELESLGSANATMIDPVFEAARHLNWLTEADIAELEKNSESSPGDSSHSD